MPRKGPAPRRDMVSDPIHHSVLVTQLVNKVMLHGKRSLAEHIVYEAMEIIATKTGEDALATVKRAVDNVKPPLEVKSRRVGGATYQVPVEVRAHRANTLAIRWIVDFARARREKTMAECLAAELMDAANGLGAAVKKARRHAEDGGVQQGLRPLPLLIAQPPVDATAAMRAAIEAAAAVRTTTSPNPWVGAVVVDRRTGRSSPPAPRSRRAARTPSARRCAWPVRPRPGPRS